MFPIDTTGLVGLLGLLTQCAVAWIFVAFFAVLARSAGRPAWFAEWTYAFAALAVGLTAMSLRFAWPLFHPGTWFLAESDLDVRAAYALYVGGKVLHVTLLCSGTLSLARGSLAPRLRRGIFAAGALAAALLALSTGDLRTLMVAQSPLMSAALAASAVLFARLPAARRDVGTRTAALALCVAALLWSLYGWAFWRADGVPWPLRRDPGAALLAYNSYLDLAVMITLAAGLSAALQQDAQRRLRELQSERERLAHELAQDEKLRALGTLVSGVAHELNNPLAAILGAAEELRGVERAPARVARLDGLIAQARRAASLVERLTGLKRRWGADRTRVRVGTLLERVRSALDGPALAQGVVLELAGALDLELLVEERAVERALVALLDNALRVSPRGARVRLEARLAGARVEIAVEDRGPGVPSELRTRIFEPFFTTDPSQDRLGLGLSLAHATARAHDGELWVDATEDGARFVLALPRERPAVLLGVAEGAPGPEPARDGGPLVLVVDDEPLLREVLVAFGRREGWRVECAADGESALRRLRESHAAPDCVLCDLRLPGLSGARLHELACQIDPALGERFLFHSGDVTSPEAESVALRTGRPVLEKPFAFARLRELVEHVCARGAAGSAR